jgi:large repetitive protein
MSGATAVAAASLCIVLAAPMPASAGTLSCGEKITADTTLQNDLVDCPNRGIVIGADDITLDLNGHTVDGDGTPFGSCPEGGSCDIGIFANHDDGVVIKGGSVTDFDVGVIVARSKRSEVHGVTASENASFGLIVTLSSRVEVTRSSGINGPTDDSDGLGLFVSDHIRIARNTFSDNGEIGIHMFGANHSSITSNVMSGSDDFLSLLVEDSNGNRVSHNRMEGNGIGIILLGSRNSVTHNRISGSDDVSISLEDGHDNLLAGNRVDGPAKSGIRVGSFEPALKPRDSVVRENVVEGAGRIGIFVKSGAGHTAVLGNRASQAQRDGIQVQVADAAVARNHVSGNGRYGINAHKGVRDGGGNEAAGNGHQPQCRNVVCG